MCMYSNQTAFMEISALANKALYLHFMGFAKCLLCLQPRKLTPLYIISLWVHYIGIQSKAVTMVTYDVTYSY